MKAQDAIAVFAARSLQADVWVSDMCLHELSAQREILAAARDAGVLRRGGRRDGDGDGLPPRRGALVVLTLKCNRGHSKRSYDAQVEAEVENLGGILQDIQVIHLFSNRSGERTVIGFVR